MTIKSVHGPVGYLRVHVAGTKYGPPHDQLDADVIVKVTNTPGAYGFRLRADGDLPVAQAMFELISDAFNAGQAVTLEYEELPGKANHPIIRVIRET